MIKHVHTPPVTAGQLIILAFIAFANYQVLKWMFLAIKSAITSDLLSVVIFKLTPKSVIQKREVRRKLQIHQTRLQKEKDHQEALESHRKYKAPFFNLQFISEDRTTLFKGFDINWQEGNQKIGQTKKPWVVENQEIAFSMFSEMAAKRFEIQRLGRWNPEMEKLWVKILPRRFVSKEKEMTDLEKAIIDFDDDIPTKASA
jgi:hypothetical protein